MRYKASRYSNVAIIPRLGSHSLWRLSTNFLSKLNICIHKFQKVTVIEESLFTFFCLISTRLSFCNHSPTNEVPNIENAFYIELSLRNLNTRVQIISEQYALKFEILKRIYGNDGE